MADQSGNTQSKVARYAILLAFVVGLGMVGLTLLSDVDSPNHPHLAAFLNTVKELAVKLGEALIVAATLAVIVDRSIKEQLVKDVVEAASPKLIGKHLPEAVQNRLLEYFEIAFVRSDWIIEYTIAPTDEAGYLSVRTVLRSFVQNFGPRTRGFKLLASIDRSVAPKSLGEPQITRIQISSEFNPTPLYDGQPNDAKITKADGSKLYEGEFLLEPRTRYTTVIESEEFFPEQYVLPLFTATTVAGCEMRVLFDQALLDVNIEVPSAPDLKLESHGTRGLEWKIMTVLLPGHCVVTSWSPKRHE